VLPLSLLHAGEAVKRAAIRAGRTGKPHRLCKSLRRVPAWPSARDAAAIRLLACRYTTMKARQDSRVAHVTMQLSELSVARAQSGVTLATLQRDKASIQLDHWDLNANAENCGGLFPFSGAPRLARHFPCRCRNRGGRLPHSTSVFPALAIGLRFRRIADARRLRSNSGTSSRVIFVAS